MRILINCPYYFPELIGIGKYTHEMAEWLAQRGHNIRVVTAPPHYPAWQVGEGYRPWRYMRETIRGVEIWRCPILVPKKPSPLKRLIYLLSFAFFSFPVVLYNVLWRPDVIFTIEPPFLCVPQVLLAARLCNAKALLHVQDFEVQAFFAFEIVTSKLLKKYIIAVESWLMRQFDNVSSISDKMVLRLHDLNVLKQRTFLFPNWVNIKHICPNAQGHNFRKAWNLGDSNKIILYAGNIGEKQGLKIVIEAAQVFQETHPDLLFLIVGEGHGKDSLVKLVDRLELKNVVFKPIQPAEDLPSLLSMADIHLIIQRRDMADVVMPSKLSGILASGGVTVITADQNTELGKLVVNNPAIALLVEPDNNQALVNAVLYILNNPEFAEKCQTTARDYAIKNLDVNVILANFEKKLFEIV